MLARVRRAALRPAVAVLTTLLLGCAAAATTDATGGVFSPSGQWKSGPDNNPLLSANLTVDAAALSGTGAIHVDIPNYTGDDFTITSGSFNNPNVTFSGSLGSNPDGHGGAYVGSISFTGTMTAANAMTGTMVYTPPRTLTMTFATQTVTGVTLTKP